MQRQWKAHELNVFIFTANGGEVVDLMVHTSYITVGAVSTKTGPVGRTLVKHRCIRVV